MRKLAVVLGAGMVLGLCAEALAGEAGPRPGRMSFADRLKQMDTDGDGQISAEEWKGREEGFKRLDADGDGVISKEEMAKLQRTMRSRRMARPSPFFILADLNKDGKLSRDELQAATAALLKADKDGDGLIDPSEYQQATAAAAVQAVFKSQDKNDDGMIAKDEWRGREEHFQRMDANSDGNVDLEEFTKARGPKPRRPGGGKSGLAPWFARMDTDGDGQITQEEFTGREEFFKRLDANGDGVIDKDEAAKARRPGQGMRRQQREPAEDDDDDDDDDE